MLKLSRITTGVAALVGAAALLVGCSTDSSSESGDSAANSEDGTRVVETKFGEVEVPEDAERIMALGWGDTETAFALGV